MIKLGGRGDPVNRHRGCLSGSHAGGMTGLLLPPQAPGFSVKRVTFLLPRCFVLFTLRSSFKLGSQSRNGKLRRATLGVDLNISLVILVSWRLFVLIVFHGFRKIKKYLSVLCGK